MMKFYTSILCFLLSVGLYAQSSDSTIVMIKNYAGVEIFAGYKLINEKPGKKEYKIKVWYKNTTEKDVFYKSKDGSDFGTVTLNGLSSYVYYLKGLPATKKVGKNKINILAPKKIFETYYFEKWYNGDEVPEFIFKPNNKVILENDYERYNN